MTKYTGPRWVVQHSKVTGFWLVLDFWEARQGVVTMKPYIKARCTSREDAKEVGFALAQVTREVCAFADEDIDAEAGPV